MTSTIKVNNIQNQCGANIINESANTITIGASGDTITLACGASQTGFGRTGTVDWDTTAKTAGFTAVSGNGYFVNTTSGAITVTLPASPSAGDIVSIADYTNTFQTNSVTVARNGSNIGGVAADAVLTTEGQSVTFVYVDGTEGWKNVQDSTSNVTGSTNLIATGGTITTCGDYKIHTFTGPGTFTVSQVSQTAADNTVSYLVIGGGAGGGTVYAGGGGGAGGFREYRAPLSGCYAVSPLNGSPAITVTATTYPITVGAGGGPGCSGTPNQPTSRGNPGSVSTFSTITSAGGGGGGGGGNDPRPLNPGDSGGSGGGGMGNCGTAAGSGGAGNTPPVSPPQGNNGGSATASGPTFGAGAGGGAGAVGGAGTTSAYGNGGAGVSTSITGSATSYAGGGGAGKVTAYPAPGGNASPCGTGGIGANNPSNVGGNGTTNTGGGGGGGSWNTEKAGGTGGSGIVIIRYKYQ